MERFPNSFTCAIRLDFNGKRRARVIFPKREDHPYDHPYHPETLLRSLRNIVRFRHGSVFLGAISEEHIGMPRIPFRRKRRHVDLDVDVRLQRQRASARGRRRAFLPTREGLW